MTYELHPLCARVRQVFDYDADTGALHRRIATSARVKVGARAGYSDRHGHLRVSLDGEQHALHRLIWLHVTGHMPSGDIDHINGDRGDNRWSNLRDVTHRVNIQNRKRAAAHNTCGVLGVSKRGGSYLARINHNGQQVCLGSFPSAGQAHAAYLAAKRQFHEGCTL